MYGCLGNVTNIYLNICNASDILLVSTHFCLFVPLLVWVLPDADHETKIQVEIAFGGSAGNTCMGVGKGSREERTPKKQLPQ